MHKKMYQNEKNNNNYYYYYCYYLRIMNKKMRIMKNIDN